MLNFLFRPFKFIGEIILGVLGLYMIICTLIQSFQMYQGGRETWVMIMDYQEKLEQIQTLNPFD